MRIALSGRFQAKKQPSVHDWLGSTGIKDRDGQNLKQWRKRAARRPPPSPPSPIIIALQPLGELTTAAEMALDVQLLAQCVSAFYTGAHVVCLAAISSAELTAALTIRPSRGYGDQLLTGDCHELLERRRRQHAPEAFIIMGFTLLDLYPEDEWNFVFGQARISKGTGIFSFSRYVESDDPRARRLLARTVRSFADPAAGDSTARSAAASLFTRRCMRVLCHELGHLFGMKHCIYWECAMNGSNHVDESDGQPLHLCPMCLAKLHEALHKPDLVQREKALEALMRTSGLSEAAEWHAAQVALLTDGASADEGSNATCVPCDVELCEAPDAAGASAAARAGKTGKSRAAPGAAQQQSRLALTRITSTSAQRGKRAKTHSE